MNLQFEVVYSQRRTIGISVERDRRVVVRAPKGATAEVVAAAVNSKRLWIWGKIRDSRKIGGPTAVKEFVAGESFLVLGESFGLRLVSEPRGVVRLNARNFELSKADRRDARNLFAEWYRERARTELPPRVAAMAGAMAVPIRQIVVRDMRYRWGSCSPGGTLTFNWRIVQAPIAVIDYVVAHESAHLLEPSHTPAFWNIVAVHAPLWQKARTWLRHHGGRLEW